MFLLVLSRFSEDVGNLLESPFPGGTGEVGVAISCLRLSGECFEKVLLRFGAFD